MLKSIDEQYEDLDRAERRLAEEEEAAEREIAAARVAAEEAMDTLDAALSRAREGHRSSGDEAAAAAARRLEGVVAPPLRLDDHHERTLSVRADHVRARRWVLDALLADLRRHAEAVEAARAAARDSDAELRAVEARRAQARAERQRLPRHPPRGRGHAGATARDPDALPTAPELPSVRPRDAGAVGPSRRAAPRVEMRASVGFSSATNFFTGFSQNISDGGLFIATEEQVSIGAEVSLTFTLPTGVEIRGAGVVRWIRDGDGGEQAGIGVSFDGLVGEAKEAIEAFLAQREPLFYPG